MWRFLLCLLLSACTFEVDIETEYEPMLDIKMKGKGYNPDFTKKLGSSVELFRGQQGFNSRRTLIDFNSNLFQDDVQERLLPGSWVATVRTEVLEDDGTSNGNPAILQVEFGEGGENTTFEVSPGPGVTFAVSSGQIRISTFLDDGAQLSDGAGGPAAGSNPIAPTRQRVSGFIKRSALATSSRRVFYRFGPFAVNDVIAGPVPKFARSIYLTSNVSNGPIDAYDPLNLLRFRSQAAAALVTYNGEQLWDAIRQGIPLAVPVGATRWFFTVGAAIPATLIGIEFHQEL